MLVSIHYIHIWKANGFSCQWKKSCWGNGTRDCLIRIEFTSEVCLYFCLFWMYAYVCVCAHVSARDSMTIIVNRMCWLYYDIGWNRRTARQKYSDSVVIVVCYLIRMWESVCWSVLLTAVCRVSMCFNICLFQKNHRRNVCLRFFRSYSKFQRSNFQLRPIYMGIICNEMMKTYRMYFLLPEQLLFKRLPTANVNSIADIIIITINQTYAPWLIAARNGMNRAICLYWCLRLCRRLIWWCLWRLRI